MNLEDIKKVYDFTGQTIVINGGTGILCRAMAQALAGCNANVAIVARNPEKGQALLPSLEGKGRSIIVQGDVLNAESLAAGMETVIKEFGRVDGLINGAGGNNPNATTRPDLKFFDLPEDAMRGVFDLNLMGTILPTQVYARQLTKQGEGVILNVSSMSAIRPLTRVVSYSAAKAAINSFTQWLAVHLATEYSAKLRVNAIAPGFFVTEQNRSLLTNPAEGTLTARGESIIAHTPMARFGDAEDLLGAVLWLMSPLSSFVTGIVVPVDGGFSAFGGV